MPPDIPPHKVSPALLKHIVWVKSQLDSHRGGCKTRPSHECTLRDVTAYQGQFDPVHLGCAACTIDLVLFKTAED